MKSQSHRSRSCFLAVSAFSLLMTLPAVTAQRTPPPTVSPPASTNQLQEIPKSIFVVPATPKEGRNPFFPNSAPQPVPVDLTKGPNTPSSDIWRLIVLNGITSPPKRTAMINGRTFEQGESGEVKLPNGMKVLLKCEEIRADSAVIILDNQRRELRLRFGL